MTKICLSWSGGRDSMMMLDKIGTAHGLLTTFQKASSTIMMHEVPLELVKIQAESLGIPLYPVSFENTPTNKQYEETMGTAVHGLLHEGFTEMAFGDLFLAEIRNYREKQLESSGLQPVFPLWGEDTKSLSKRFIQRGYRAIIVCVDEEQLDSSFLGREYDESFLQDLPEHVDPCGENGEFHSFVFDGPRFAFPVRFSVAGTFRKWDRFEYVQLKRDTQSISSI